MINLAAGERVGGAGRARQKAKTEAGSKRVLVSERLRGRSEGDRQMYRYVNVAGG